MRAHDVIIVGGGPVGCFLGASLAERGFDVLIIEEHAEIGNPVCCAGIVGAAGLNAMGIKRGDWVLNELRGAIFYPPSLEPFTINRGKVEALVIDRAAFDRDLAMRAAEEGASFLMRTKCVDVKFDECVRVKAIGALGKQEIRSRLCIGADGPASVVARRAGLLKSTQAINAAQLEVFSAEASDIAELYFGRDFAPGFFAWIAKAGDVARVGLGTTEGAALQKLFRFIKSHPIASRKINGRKVIHFTSGPIPQPMTRKIYSDRVLLVGDAAGHIKPLTGGGLFVGLSCARLAADVAVRALENEPTAEALREYEKEFKKRFGNELSVTLRAQRAFQRMSDAELDKIFKIFAREDIRELIMERGDFDFHGDLVKTLLRRGLTLLPSLGLGWLLKSFKTF